jgi:adenine-specific DNA-methyltransferase
MHTISSIMKGPSHRLQRVQSILGRPYCEGRGYAIYCLDCLDGMKSLPPQLFDLTVTSPPYNIGKEYEQSLPLADYLAWCQKCFHEIHRLTSERGAFWLNLGYVDLPDRARAIPLPYLLWDKCPFFLVQEVVWNYGAGVAARKALSPRNEKFLWYVKNPDQYTFNLDDIRDPDVAYPNQTKRGKLRCNTIGKNPSDVWQIAKVTSGTNRSSSERAPHPAQFPIDLIARIIKGFSNPGELVLDPFMGSGTTAEVCLREDRDVLGFEVRPDYCDFISRRLARVVESQRSLFGT